MKSMELIDSKKIEKFFKSKLSKINLDQSLIDSTISSLVEASLFGIDSHGVNLFRHYYDCLNNGRIKKGKDLEFVINGTCLTCNANNNLANYAAKKSLLKLEEISNKSGIAIASIKNSDHIGAVGIHSVNSKIKNKLILGFTNADALAVTPDGKNVLFGTNPISLVLKSEDDFLYIDLATTKFSMNKVKNYRRDKLDLPLNFARDKSFKKTIDPNKAAFLEPIGEHKGFALAYLVEILTSGLASQNHSANLLAMYGTDLEKSRGVSHTYIMINPSFFHHSTLESVIKTIKITNANVTNQQKSMLPGNKELNSKENRLKHGIPVQEIILKGWIDLGFKND